MSLTSGYTVVCDADCSGGVLNIAVMDKADIAVDGITYDATETTVTALTLLAGATKGFRLITLDIEKAAFTATETKNDANCGYSGTAELKLTVDCAPNTFAIFLQQLKALCCSGLVVAVETSAGVRLLGIRDFERSHVTLTEETVEQNFDGRNDTTVTLGHKGRRSPAFWSDAFTDLPFASA